MGVRIVWVVLLFVIRVVNCLQAEVRVAPVPIPGVASKEGEDLGILVLDSAGKYQRMSGEIIAPNQVRISHPGVKTPKSIRYAWEGFPNANLFGEGKMPAFPFRTDQFDPNSEH